MLRRNDKQGKTVCRDLRQTQAGGYQSHPTCTP
jgi:hypothetical protein